MRSSKLNEGATDSQEELQTSLRNFEEFSTVSITSVPHKVNRGRVPVSQLHKSVCKDGRGPSFVGRPSSHQHTQPFAFAFTRSRTKSPPATTAN